MLCLLFSWMKLNEVGIENCEGDQRQKKMMDQVGMKSDTKQNFVDQSYETKEQEVGMKMHLQIGENTEWNRGVNEYCL